MLFQRFQTEKQWLDRRKNYIGGSDASAILGLNPWKSNVELWEEKTGRREAPDLSDNEFVQYGKDAEKHLRELFALDFPQYRVEQLGINMYTNQQYPFAHASLDGELIERETGRKGILEIKTTNILHGMSKAKWEGRIPDNYYTQVLHYLMVTEYDFAVVKAQLKSMAYGEVYLQTRHYHIERADVEEDILYLSQKEEEFWKCVTEDRQPSLVLPAI